MATRDTSEDDSWTAPVVCTAPSQCANDTFKVKDDRTNEVLKLVCTDCGHEQQWKLNEE